MSTNINLNGVMGLDFNLQGSTSAAITSPGVVTLTNTLPIATTSTNGVVRPDGTSITISGGIISAVTGPVSSFHDEPLTDGNANFIFASTPTKGGDIIVVLGVK